jgi:hypothetical protein
VITATLAALLRWWEGFRNRASPRRLELVPGPGAARELVASTVAAPGPPCHCGAVNAGPVSAGARRVCLLLAIAGSVLLMSGVLLVAGAGILGGAQSRGWRPATLIALGLIACGLLCGAVVVAIAVPGGRRAGGRTRRPVGAARPRRPARLLPRPAPASRPAPEEEWLQALRPDGPPSIRRPPPQPGSDPG